MFLFFSDFYPKTGGWQGHCSIDSNLTNGIINGGRSFLHWTTIEPKATDLPGVLDWGNFLDPIDLREKEYELLAFFHVIKGQEKSKEPIKIYHTDFRRGCPKEFGMDKIENRFKITIYGDNIEPATETYRLDRDGKKYSQIEMQKINHKEANNG